MYRLITQGKPPSVSSKANMTSLFPATFDTSFRTKEKSGEELSPPSGFCLTSDGNFLIADDFNHRIQVYDSQFNGTEPFLILKLKN